MGTRGGLKRAEIIERVRRRPYNANEIARLIGVDYKTARHHLKVLIDNKILDKSVERYGTLYFWSATMQANTAAWDEIWGDVGEKLESPRRNSDGEPTG